LLAGSSGLYGRAGGYVRADYLRGLKLADGVVFNPYRFGLIGSSDTHTGAISQDEETFFSKAGMLDGTADRRGSIPAPFLYGTYLKWADPSLLVEVDGKDYLQSSSFEYWSASGLAGVWAEENTREAIYAAFRRKETFATSGPRMKVRFFASHSFTPEQLNSPGLIRTAYQHGAAMGGELEGSVSSPTFLVWAVADANGTSLQRAQVIKGYIRDCESVEEIYDVACADGLTVDPETHRCPGSGAAVDLRDCSISAGAGSTELKTLWQDPQFVPELDAFYCVREPENPSCRWTICDAIRAGATPRSELPATLRERVWSSPTPPRPGVCSGAAR